MPINVPEMDDLTGFRNYLITQGRKKLTINRHLLWVKKIQEICPGLPLEGVIQYLAQKKLLGQNNNSINSIVTSLRCYAHFAGRADLLEGIKYKPRDTSFERATLSDEEVDKLLRVRKPKRMWKNSWTANMMILRIMFFTGLRPREACSIHIEDIDFGLNVIRIKPEYAKTPGNVPIPETLEPHLRKYMLSTGLEKGLLFPALAGGKDNDGMIDPALISLFFRKLLKLAKIPYRPNLTPYSARHTYGTRLGEEDVNMKTIKELMRHSKITTTEIYLHPGLKTLKKAQLKIPYISKTSDPQTKLKAWVEAIESLNIDGDKRFNFRLQKESNSFSLDVYIKSVLFFVLTSGIHGVHGYLYKVC